MSSRTDARNKIAEMEKYQKEHPGELSIVAASKKFGVNPSTYYYYMKKRDDSNVLKYTKKPTVIDLIPAEVQQSTKLMVAFGSVAEISALIRSLS